MTPWPDAEDLLALLAESTGPDGRVRDAGILVAVATRPHARLLGGRAYPTILDQAAALLHGIAAWRPLEMWNAGLAWGATLTMIDRAGFVLPMPVTEQMALVDAIGTGAVDSVEEIALRLSPHLRVR